MTRGERDADPRDLIAELKALRETIAHFELQRHVDPDQPLASGVSLPVSVSRGDAPQISVGVHLHVHEPRVLVNMATELALLSDRFPCVVTATSESAKTGVVSFLRSHSLTADVRVVPNRGRDIAPLIIDLADWVRRHDVVLHLHSKETRDSDLGRRWLDHLLRHLVGSPHYLRNVVNIFEREPRCGLLMPPPFPPVARHMIWGANREHMSSLLRRLDVEPTIVDDAPPIFPAGNMFWFRPDALHQLFDARLDRDDFPEEPLTSNFSIAHAIERCTVMLALENGYDARSIQPLPPAYYGS